MDIKSRDAYYCNLKLLLLYLMVLGHLLEGRLEYPVFSQLYRVIYTVHMPLFVFLSGFFLRDGAGCRQQARRMLTLYGLCQFPIAVLGRLAGTDASLLVPYWHLWYLLSAGCMAAAGWAWFAAAGRWQALNRTGWKCALVALAVLLGCLAGRFGRIGRTLSLSRTLCFLPYFLLGLFLPKSVDWHTFRRGGILALLVWLALFGVWGRHIPVQVLYQADCFARTGIQAGCLTRLGCYLLGAALGFFLLTAVPAVHLPCSKLGANTLAPYLLHAPLVQAVALLRLPDPLWAVGAPAAAIYILLFLHKAAQWRSPLYAVWRRSRKEA